jgi:NAD(P)-dependent dehydrogenase (short-subunit alcohol dehydrogenase family)
MSVSLVGRSVVVVGASSGIGRGMAIRAVRGGADVILASRRADRLAEVVSEAGGGHPIPTDLRNGDDCVRLCEEVAGATPRIDLLFVSAGAAPLRRMVATSSDDWTMALETNLVGIHRLIAGLLPLLAPSGIVAVVSSEAVTAPRSHLGAYGASKAALEHSVLQWQEEHPWLRFTTISLGATVPTEFGHGFATEDIVEAIGVWATSGKSQSAFMDAEEVCDVLASTLGTLMLNPSVGVPRIELRSPAPFIADGDAATDAATATGSHPAEPR